MSTESTNGCCVDRLWAERNPTHPDTEAVKRKACSAETCMSLPDGKTCGDCVHKRRCVTFGFADSETNTSCSFFPRRFVRAREKAVR